MSNDNQVTYIALPAEVYESIAKYILSKPYAEVRGLVESIEQSARTFTLKDDDDDEDVIDAIDQEGSGDAEGSD